MVEVSPHLSLAFALHSSPGTYALLLGAGVSLPSGVPGAWQVLRWLIGDVAAAAGRERPAHPEAWWKQTYGEDPTYDRVLGALTNSGEERRRLLAQFFEPTPEEREEGKKQPTAAHRAIARLVQLETLHLILTTNFDLLTETALREADIQPVVVSTPDAIAGMAPLHSQPCAVVHLHGDYISPGVLNTEDELGKYNPVVNSLLDQVFGEYGLVVVGWSAEWDVALRAALERAPGRRFATYWVEPGEPKEHARRLIATRDAAVAMATADDFLGHLADSVESLMVVTRRDPRDVPTAVAAAKRQLAGGHVAIDLHDRLRTEMERVASTDPLATADFNATSPEEHGRRLRQLEADTELLLALVATAAYWGDESTDGWWFDDIARFGARPIASGSTALLDLVQLPATAILYAAGISAAGARRYDLLLRLLTEPTTTNNSDERVSVASHLPPSRVWHDRRSHRRLHCLLRALFEDHLGLGEAAYRDASERFEYLRLVQVAFERQQRENLHRDRRELEQRIAEIPERIADLEIDPKSVMWDHTGEPTVFARDRRLSPSEAEELKRAREELPKRQEELSQLQEKLRNCGRAVLGVPHIRAFDRRDGYTSAPAQSLEAEIARNKAKHALLQAGLCGGDVVQLRWSMTAVNTAFEAFASEAAWSSMPPNGGFLPSAPFYPDEIGKWARAASE